MASIPYIHPIKIPFSPMFPDPHLTWMCQIVHEWDYEEQADVGIIGIPFDGGVVGHRRGARLAPKFVREMFYAGSAYNLELDVELSNLNIVDCGDVEVDLLNYEETHRRVRAALTPIFKDKIIPLIIGGDHSLTAPCVKALCDSIENREKVRIIDFDSHLDCRSDWKPPHQSGLWVTEILKNCGSHIRGENLIQIGIHGFQYSPFYKNYVKKAGIKIFTPTDVYKRGIESIMEEALEQASNGTDAIYVTVDIDVLDQAYAPGTNAPIPGGLATLDLITGVSEAGKHSLICALDLMEIAPPHDFNNMTSKIGAEILLKFLCGLSQRKRG